MADKYNAIELRQMLAKGQAMKNPAGDPSYPIADEEDLGAAIHAVGRGGASADAIRKYIMGRAKALGKTSMIPDTWNADGSLGEANGSGADAMSDRAEPSSYTRSYVLEDISIRAGGDGRTVDAYAAVFDSATPIRDQDGEYDEILDPTCFNRAIDHAQRSGHKIPVMFNHGQTMYGTPSELDTMPIGVTEDIKADRRGLFTRARYHKSDRADSILEGIREGSIASYSFQGAFKRSDPGLSRGSRYRKGQTVRRMESTLREYGPTPFPAYADAKITGVRAEQVAAMLGNLTPDERGQLVTMLQTGTSLADPAADDPPDEGHSTRSPHEKVRATYAQFLSRQKGAANA